MKSCIICHNNVRKPISLQMLTNDMNTCDCNPIIHKSVSIVGKKYQTLVPFVGRTL